MFGWSLIFLGLAVIAAILGYRKKSSTFTYIAKLFFFVFLFIFIAYIFAGFFSTRAPTTTTNPPI